MKITFEIVVSLQLIAIISLSVSAMPTGNADPIALSAPNGPIRNGTIEFTSMVDPIEVGCILQFAFL